MNSYYVLKLGDRYLKDIKVGYHGELESTKFVSKVWEAEVIESPDMCLPKMVNFKDLNPHIEIVKVTACEGDTSVKENNLWVDFEALSLKHNTTVWYETFVFELSVMLTAFSEEEIYSKLIDSSSPDTLEYAIDDAKKWRGR